ncbi:MAG TPA: glycine--tRNA ligase subunit beta, partial [Rhizomicrobium sp.]|nr:glycine--tRNA ligase subunit beta [Rhizomicrobium sp.]
GLAEWPEVLIGQIDPQFMDVPAEILQTSMRVHQKYFSLRDPKTGKFANRFAVVSNMIASDGGATIVAGNERVLRARLSDAKFFWDQDRKTKLEARVTALGNIVFHAKLGTQLERVERIEALAGEIAEKIGADVKKAQRAARLCKADLTTGVVGEFPELQGIMGRYYALNDNEDADVADAVRDHYRPVGPSDAVPTNKVSIAVALADKLDQLTGFFANDEKPTGSSDPFALRRASLGVIRLILENEVRVSLTNIATGAVNIGTTLIGDADRDEEGWKLSHLVQFLGATVATGSIRFNGPITNEEYRAESARVREHWVRPIVESLLGFFADRLKVALREKGTRHDLIDAVFSLGNEDDLVRLVARVEALQAFLKTDDGANLLAGYKRAANILRAEEKKDDKPFVGKVSESHLAEPQEKALYTTLAQAQAEITPALEREDFAGAMRVMAALRAPVDAFFDKVKVNADDPVIRNNRLNLLAALRAMLLQVADFSKIEG